MNKLVAVINKSVEPGRAMNTLAHLSFGLGAALGPDSAELMDYIDADGNSHPNISKMPYVVLRATGGKLRTLAWQAKEAGITCLSFTDTMTIGSWEDQKAKTSTTKEADLTYLGVVLIGPPAAISDLTRKFSLY